MISLSFHPPKEIASSSKRVPKAKIAKATKTKPAKKRHIEIEYELEDEKPRQKIRH